MIIKIANLKKSRIEGFTLVDLIIALFISSIIMIGVFKAFISNVKTTAGTMDLTSLDDKTRNIINMIQSDVNDINGNVINGMPTIFPMVNWPNQSYEEGSFNGFVLIKADPRLPILNMATDYQWPINTEPYRDITLEAGALGSLDLNVLKPHRYLFVYNFANYYWRPLLIQTVTDNNDGTYTVRAWDFQMPYRWWQYYLTHPDSCASFKVEDPRSDEEKVCKYVSGYKWQKINTVFAVGDMIIYKKEDDEVVRYENFDQNYWHEDNWTRTVVARNVNEFTPKFNTYVKSVYPDAERTTIARVSGIRNFLQGLIPGNDNPNDDCINLIGYQCMNAYASYPNVFGFSYFSSHVSGMHLKFSHETESGRKRTVNFFTSIGNNFGNSSITAATPTKILATKETSDRDYGSMIANPTMYGDPNGGGLGSPFFIAAAPMLSVPSKNEDAQNDAELVTMCNACNAAGDCTGYTTLCTSNLDAGEGNTQLDYLQCGTASPAKRRELGCVNPSGSINDRGLNTADNTIDPKIVKLNTLSSIQDGYTYDLSPTCSGTRCPLSSYYSANPLNDAVFPMTIQPYFNPSGELTTFYLGVARLRTPGYASTLRYHPFYHSAVFAIDLSDEENPTATLIRERPLLTAESSSPDVASASHIQIRSEGTSEYMYIASHEAYKVLYRKRNASDIETNNLEAWENNGISLAFEDKDSMATRFSWLYQQQDPDTEEWEDKFVHFPTETTSGMPESPVPGVKYDTNRITSMFAAEDGRIYYTTAQRVPDMIINDQTDDGQNEFFYDHTVNYNSTIINEDGQPIDCGYDPTQAGCTIGAGVPKPIDWSYCLLYNDKGANPGDVCYKNPDGTYSSQYPVGKETRASFDAKLKVAFKLADDSWEIKTIANLHDTATGISQDPSTGDLVVSAPTNIRKISFEEMNLLLAEDLEPPNVDLGSKRVVDNFYTANNDISQVLSPESPSSSLKFRRLSGLNTYPSSDRLNIVFADMVNRAVGYIVQNKNQNAKQLFGQIIYNDTNPSNNMDRNLDIPLIHTKGTKDLSEGFSDWILPFHSTAAWVDPTRRDSEGNALYASPGPTPLRPQSNITSYDPTGSRGNHERRLSNDRTSCYIDPNDSALFDGQTILCGADPLWRECAGDVLSQVSIGLMGRQTAKDGCGVSSPAPLASDDPITLPVEPSSGGGKIRPMEWTPPE